MRRPPLGMALFGMVWLLRVRSEMKRCAKCRRDRQLNIEQQQQVQARASASCSTFFTIDAPPTVTASPVVGPTTYCEVHGFNPPKEDIQEFYELTLLDENKSVQEKTAETIRIANKWEANDGPIIPTYSNNEYVIFAGLIALARGGVLGPAAVVAPAPLFAAAPPVLARVADATIDPNPAYSFAYDVQDALTGDSKSQVESRANGIVKGQYTVADPDGTRRIVDYYADPIHGFNAVVRKTPLAVVARGVAPVAAPLVAPVARAVAPAFPAPVVAPVARAFAPAVAPAPFLARSFAAPAAVAAPVAPVARLASPYVAGPGITSHFVSPGVVSPYLANAVF